MEEKKLTLISDFALCLDAHFQLRGENTQEQQTQWSFSFDSFPPLQRQILEFLKSHWEASIEALMQEIKFEYAALMQELTLLEMDALITQTRPGYYAIS